MTSRSEHRGGFFIKIMENSNIQIQFVPIELCEFNEGQIEGVPSNPRTREDAKQKNLEKSIEELPEMTVARAALCFPYNGKYVVIGGNRRLEAQRALGRAEIPIIALPADTPVEKLRRIALLDNETTGKTDWDKIMTEWDVDELKGWGVELPDNWSSKSNRNQNDLSDDFEFSYIVEITCCNELQQKELYEELTNKGLTCRVLTL